MGRRERTRRPVPAGSRNATASRQTVSRMSRPAQEELKLRLPACPCSCQIISPIHDTSSTRHAAGAELLGGLLALGDWLAPHPGPPRRVAVPDVRGLFFSVCLGITGRLGLRVTTVRLTAHPMPVDGLVVAQSLRPATRARRGSALTVQVWHPPARSVVPGRVIR